MIKCDLCFQGGTAYMLKIDRHKIIEEELRKYGSVLISDMSQKMDCSEETVRRDLKDLETQNRLKRIHGGAFLPDSDDKGAPIHLRETFLSKEKEQLADYTIKHYIEENDIIMLDCSTTCFTLAQQLFYSNMKVTIITNSLRICNLFGKQSSSLKLIAIGGTFRQRSNSFVGYQATQAMNNYLADKCFISSSAVDIKYGLVDNSMNEAQVRKSFIDHSRQCFLVADHTKFSDKADYVIAGLDAIHVIIADKKLPEVWEDTLNKLNLPIRYC